jgi:hypothetical protein
MSHLADSHCVDIWRQAADEPFGLVLRTTDQIKARAKMYAAKRAVPADSLPPGVADLELRLGTDPGELILVHKNVVLPAGAGEMDEPLQEQYNAQ